MKKKKWNKRKIVNKNNKSKSKLKRKPKKKGKGEKKKRKSSRNKGQHKRKMQRQSANSSCIKDACLKKSSDYLSMAKGTVMTKVKNFKAKKSRMDTFINQAKGKGKKMSQFAPIALKIREAGGGNSSNLTCNGAMGPGAEELKSLYTKISACEASINMTCNAELPSYNKTYASMCEKHIEAFEKLIKAASDKNLKPEESCKLWEAEDLAAAVANVGSCDLSADMVKVKDQKTKCIDAFRECRKTEGKVVDAISACSGKSVAKTKAEIAAGVANKAAASSVSEKITKAAAAPASRMKGSEMKCDKFIKKISKVTKKMANAPLSSKLLADLNAILEYTVLPCDEAEKKELVAVGEAFTTAMKVIDEAIEAKQEDLMFATGSTVSTDMGAMTTAKARSAHMMGVREAMEKVRGMRAA